MLEEAWILLMTGQRDGKKNPDLKMFQERPFHKLQALIIFGKHAGLHLGVPSLPVLLLQKLLSPRME